MHIALHKRKVNEQDHYLLLLLGVCLGILVPVLSFGGDLVSSPVLLVLIVVLGFIPLALIRKQPLWGIVLLAFTTPFSYSFSIGALPMRAIEIRTDDILLAATLVSMLLLWLKNDGAFELPKLTFVYGFLLWAGLFSTLINILLRQLPVGDLAVSGFYWLKYVQYFLVFLLTILLVRSRRDIKLVMAAAILGVVVATAWGYYQIFSGQFGFIEYGKPRATMPFDTGPNVFASYYIVLLPLIFSLMLSQDMRRWLRALLFLLLGSTGVVMLYTGSRAGLIGLSLALGTVVFLYDWGRKPAKRLAPWLAAAALGLIGYLGFISDNPTYKRLLNFDPESTWIIYRIDDIWEPLIQRTVNTNPILGHGIMLFNRVRAENYYVRLFSEQGLLGVLLFSVLIAGLALVALRNQRLAGDSALRGLGRGFLGALMGLLFASIWSDKFIVVRIVTPFWILAGLVVASYHLLHSEKESEPCVSPS
jgi:hypothetical protein